MRRRFHPAPVAVAFSCVVLFATPAATKGPVELCDARFLVAGARLTLALAAAPAFDVVALEGRRVRLADCPPATLRAKAARDGTITLHAGWRRCGGFTKLELKANLDTACTRLRGFVKGKRWKPSFTATRSRCGDGMLDRGGGEACEPAGNPACDGLCQFVVAPPITTTTVTTGTATTTSTTLPPPGCEVLCGNGRIDPGCDEECDGADVGDAACPSGAAAGTLPVCTRDCRLDLSECGCDAGSFTSTWEAIQKVVFENGKCTDPQCHGSTFPAGGLDLRPANAYASLVGVHATNGPLLRVRPEEPEESEFFLRLAASTLPGEYPAPHGTPMPSGAAPLPADTLEVLKRWIRVGAPAEGVVLGTAEHLHACLPPPTPLKIDPLTPPAPGDGLQLYAPPWPIAARGENEVCYATYYDVTKVPGLVPADAMLPCPATFTGITNPSRLCWAYRSTLLAQDPNSHHSLIYVYSGVVGVTDPAWGAWTCKGGLNDGLPCDPTRVGEPVATGGADCGPRSGCTTPIQSGVGCIGFGPYDYQQTNVQIGGSQEPRFDLHFAPGVYAPMPAQGIVVWNSHAFNLTDTPTTNEQYLNMIFAQQSADEQRYQVQALFDSSKIFWDGDSVPPFQQKEYCWTHRFQQNTHLFYLSSHTHRHGKRFRVWGPPNANCTALATCLPDATRTPIYESHDYGDPLQLYFDPPVVISSPDGPQRRYKFCSLYDNGATDPAEVKRRSTSPQAPFPLTGLLGGPCAANQAACLAGPHRGAACGATAAGEPDHAFCDTSPGLGDGLCDACPVRGGVTTEDEMFITLGAYYVAP